MTLINESHDSLPYIDKEPSASEREGIERLIRSDLPTDYKIRSHPLLPTYQDARFSDIFEVELERRAANLPLEGGVDSSRYLALEPPQTDPTSDETRPQVLDKWRNTLRQAYTLSAYLSSRTTNLALLEEFGKNSWLIGNSQLEDILRYCERDLTRLNEATASVNKERKFDQTSAHPELRELETSWQRGVGKLIEVEIASEKLRQDVIQCRREKTHLKLQTSP